VCFDYLCVEPPIDEISFVEWVKEVTQAGFSGASRVFQLFDTTSGGCFIENSNANAEIAVVHIGILEHVVLWV